jgi:chorismate mutase-like protein
MTPAEGDARIEECRERIDAIDIEMTALLNERAKLAGRIGEVKKVLDLPIYAPKREQMVYDNIFAHNQGPLRNDALRRIYERVIDEMRNLEKQLSENQPS